MTETTETPMSLATLRAGQRLRGLVPGQTVTLIAIDPIDAGLFEVFYRDDSGRSGARAITSADAARFEIAGDFDSAPAYDADPDEFRLAAEALRIKYAALYDPMVAVKTIMAGLYLKELGFLLFHEAEKKGAILFNALVSAWGDVNEQARKYASTPRSSQQAFDFDEDKD